MKFYKNLTIIKCDPKGGNEVKMLQWYDYILIITSIILIVLCLLQGGKSEGASGAITGGGLNVFVKTKERGSEKVVSVLTFIVAAIFFILAIVIQVLAAAGVE